MKITKDLRVGDIYMNPIMRDLWILRKKFIYDYDNQAWVLELVHDDYEEDFLNVEDFIKVGNIYDLVENEINKKADD